MGKCKITGVDIQEDKVIRQLKQVEVRGGEVHYEDWHIIKSAIPDINIPELGKAAERVRKIFSQFGDAISNVGKSLDIQEEESHIGLRALDNLDKKGD